MISSENAGFSDQIKTYIVIDNNDIIKITCYNNKIEYNCDIKRYKLNNRVMLADNNLPCEYDHWMLKEIMEQPLCINQALNNGGRISGNTSVKIRRTRHIKKSIRTCRNMLFYLVVEHHIMLGYGV